MLGQILAVIAGSSALTFLLFLSLLFLLVRPPPPPWPWRDAYRIAAFINEIRAVPPDSRAAAVAAAQSPELAIASNPKAVPCGIVNSDSRDMQRVLESELGDAAQGVMVRSCGWDGNLAEEIQILAKAGGETFEFRNRRPASGGTLRFITFPIIIALLFLCSGVAGLSAWAVSRVIGPLRRLSSRVDAFGQVADVAAILEEGPLEIRRVTRAFNLMQERIARAMRDRTRMLAAISHDLRTPLTRMRLQLEAKDFGESREKMARNLDLMQSMVTSALAFLSGSFDQEEGEQLDIAALLLTLCDEFEEAGYSVHYAGLDQLAFFCRPNAMARALANLIENGCHFGTEVFIKLAVASNSIIIDVLDNGPGIPEDRKQDVIEPFVRLDPSRSARPGSVGLGLSIVQEIAKAHGGTLTLLDRIPSGLIARLEFPRN
ncbi:MAG: sensor histidine kinase [Methylovirgula sp.]